MRNILRKAGIIAFAAVIGLAFFSCGPAEDDPEMKITITGLSEYSGKYGAVAIVSPANIATFWESDDPPDGQSNITSISGSSTTFALLDASGSPLVNKSGTYVVILMIAEDQAGYDIIFVGATAIGGTSIGNSTTSIAFSDIDDWTSFLFGPAGTEADPIPLDQYVTTPSVQNHNQWYEGEVTEVSTAATQADRNADVTTGAIWFSIPVTQNLVYNIFWDDDYGTGGGVGYCTADILVAAKYQGDSTFTIFGAATSTDNTGRTSSNRGADQAYNTPKTFTANKTGTVLLRVLPETAVIPSTTTRSGEVPGTFAITYTVGSGVVWSVRAMNTIIMPVIK